MKRITAILMCLALVCSLFSAAAEETTESRKKVVILATGGTIAGVGEAGKTAGYKPGALTAEDLLAAVPQLEDVADIEAIQVCNVNSDDMTAEVWLTLADTINEMAADPETLFPASACRIPQRMLWRVQARSYSVFALSFSSASYANQP